jgi:hypothetical protein
MPGTDPHTGPEQHAELYGDEPDPGDAWVAWNFGTRELTAEEHARFAEYARGDLDRKYAAREATAGYAAWKAENPEAAAAAEAEFRAASRAAFPLLWGLDPEPESEPEAEL